MTPKCWQDVLVEKARCEGWIIGWTARSVQCTDELALKYRERDALSDLCPCEVCGGRVR
jgi:hypothetical protein